MVNSGRLTKLDVDNMINSLQKERTPIPVEQTTLSHILTEVLGKFPIFKPCVSKKNKRAMNVLENASKQLDRDRDIVNIVKSVRLMRVLNEGMMTPRQKILLQYQMDNVITSDSSPEED